MHQADVLWKRLRSKVFSKLDAKHRYWSIKLDEESSKLTTFNSPCRRFRFKRLPFGLNLSQDAFQQSMDRILSQRPGTIGITDDVIVHGKDEEYHDRNRHPLMQVAQKCGLVFNIDKSKIKTPQIKFFGMIYDADGVHPDPTKCAAEIQALPSPKNVTELQRFLGIVQYMSSFIPTLADHTALFRTMIKKDSKFEWNDSLQQAFERVESMVCEDMSLSYFDYYFIQFVRNTFRSVIDSVYNVFLFVFFFYTLIIANRYYNWSCLLEA